MQPVIDKLIIKLLSVDLTYDLPILYGAFTSSELNKIKDIVQKMNNIERLILRDLFCRKKGQLDFKDAINRS